MHRLNDRLIWPKEGINSHKWIDKMKYAVNTGVWGHVLGEIRFEQDNNVNRPGILIDINECEPGVVVGILAASQTRQNTFMNLLNHKHKVYSQDQRKTFNEIRQRLLEAVQHSDDALDLIQQRVKKHPERMTITKRTVFQQIVFSVNFIQFIGDIATASTGLNQ